jgi:transposase
MPRQSPYPIVLTPEERAILEARARKYTLPYRDVVRARVILLAAEGVENKEIAQRLGMARPHVSKWRKRFFYQRLGGLEERPRRGRPPDFSPSGCLRGEGPGLPTAE